MPRPFIYPWVLAEAQAFPFWASAAAELRILTVDRVTPGALSRDCEALSAAFEQHVLPRTPGMSVDVLRHIRDAAWFKDGVLPSDMPHPAMNAAAPAHRATLAQSLGELLMDLAGTYLEPRGARVGLRTTDNIADTAQRWRWLSLSLPSDLLVAALSYRCGRLPMEDSVELVTPQLAQVLASPCAETHLHAGSAVPFGMLWSGLMRSLADAPPAPSELRSSPLSGGAADGEAALALLFSAAIVRTLLAAFLIWRARGGVTRFAEFAASPQGPLRREIAPRLSFSGCEHDAYASCHRALQVIYFGSATRALGSGTKPSPRLSWQRAHALYRALIGPARWLTAQERMAPHAAYALDPLACDSGALWGTVTAAGPELLLAFRCLAYLKESGKKDNDFATLFWQYQRVRCQIYRSLTESPGTPGLDWFGRFFERIRPLRKALSHQLMSVALRIQSRDLNLGALEVRTTPENTCDKVRDLVRHVAAQAAAFTPTPGYDRPEVGLVLHFKKERMHKTLRGLRPHASPETGAYGFRHGAWFHARQQEASAVCSALASYPALLLVLRGVDVASSELAQPTWAVMPLLAQVRSGSHLAAARLSQRQPTWRVPPLRITMHAGEDYRRLAEGLRRVHEPIEFELLGPGDRIGHAVALGVDVKRELTRLIAQPAEERLDDLLWELDLYRRAVLPISVARLEYARVEALRLGRQIYGGDDCEVTPDNLVEARRLRHRIGVLTWLGFPFKRAHVPELRGASKLLWRYLSDADVYRRGQSTVEVACDSTEVAMLQAAQRFVRSELGRLEITVESNPSSNLLIGDLTALEQSPALRLQPLVVDPNEPPVLVSLNTDNPVTFSSCLADEFAHTYFALIRLGVGAPETLRWLDHAREVGWRSRFTLRQSTSQDALRTAAGSLIRSR